MEKIKSFLKKLGSTLIDIATDRIFIFCIGVNVGLITSAFIMSRP